MGIGLRRGQGDLPQNSSSVVVIDPVERRYRISALPKVGGKKNRHVWVGFACFVVFFFLEHSKIVWCLFSSKPQTAFEEKKRNHFVLMLFAALNIISGFKTYKSNTNDFIM